MKKRFFYGLIIITIIISLGFTACEGPEGPAGPQGPQGFEGAWGTPGSSSYVVVFDSNGGIPAFNFVSALHGASILPPYSANPSREGEYLCKFDGWYKNYALTDPWDFATDVVTNNITLYAKYKPYDLGDTGPGNGTIFYRSETGFPVEGYGTPLQPGYFPAYTAHYLEIAPIGWNGIIGDPQFLWGSATTTGLETEIGKGRKNTIHIIVEGDGDFAEACFGVIYGKADWFLPSEKEFEEIWNYYNEKGLELLPSGFYITNGLSYWSSSRSIGRINGDGDFEMTTGSTPLLASHYIRPIRAFK